MNTNAPLEYDLYGGCKTIRGNATGFFHTERIEDRWWFVTPEGHGFLSIGLNHIDAGALKQPDTVDLYRTRYRGSDEVWVKEGVVEDLRKWGFNSIGWVQEVYFPDIHTPNWNWERYDWANMPYCHCLNTADCAYWEKQPRYPDIFSSDWEDYIDSLARYWCTQMADDPRLIGYFFADIPDWFGQKHTGCGWLHGIEDPWSETGRKAVDVCARRYNQVIHDAIRRYDTNHLLLGDRWLANDPIPDEALLGAAPWVDVLSFQFNGGDFPAKASDFERWSALVDKPILLADTLIGDPRKLDDQKRIEFYQAHVHAAYAAPYVIGSHLCGAYLKNEVRGYGIKDGHDDESIFAENLCEIHSNVYQLASK